MLRLIRGQAVVSGSAVGGTGSIAVLERRAAENGGAPAERAQRDVAALYEERGEEFLHYALVLGRDEELARDALQEAFMRYFVALFEGNKIVAPRAWIYRVMHNYLLDRIKEGRRLKEHRLIEKLSYAQDQDIEGECFRQEFLRLIRTALTAREYDCLRLRAGGMRYQEIAATLDLKCGTVGTLISRALRKLRNITTLKREKNK